MRDGLQIDKCVLGRVTIRVLDLPSLDLETPEGRGFLARFSAMGEREHPRISSGPPDATSSRGVTL
jgi:hypothetical protein